MLQTARRLEQRGKRVRRAISRSPTVVLDQFVRLLIQMQRAFTFRPRINEVLRHPIAVRCSQHPENQLRIELRNDLDDVTELSIVELWSARAVDREYK